MKSGEEDYIPKCKSCRFFVELYDNTHMGLCHRNAPLPDKYNCGMNAKTNNEDSCYWGAKVSSMHWCGQHEFKKKAGKK